MVVDTVLSVMAYDYPPEKINVYLSDDGCSDLMFYALSEASNFSRFWLPFCRNFNVEPRAPGIYFSAVKQEPSQDLRLDQERGKLEVCYVPKSSHQLRYLQIWLNVMHACYSMHRLLTSHLFFNNLTQNFKRTYHGVLKHGPLPRRPRALTSLTLCSKFFFIFIVCRNYIKKWRHG